MKDEGETGELAKRCLVGRPEGVGHIGRDVRVGPDQHAARTDEAPQPLRQVTGCARRGQAIDAVEQHHGRRGPVIGKDERVCQRTSAAIEGV
ncbi:hypothetical protein [Roseovarius indicus]|nr:hypothetical protein [Roseovarius indicus]